MNPSDLAAQLRNLANQLQRDGKYDPAKDYILDKIHGIVNHNARMAYRLVPVFRDAHKTGAFNGPLADFDILVCGAQGDNAMLEVIFQRLESRGWPCWGLDSKRGAIERLADAFAALTLPNTDVFNAAIPVSQPLDHLQILSNWANHYEATLRGPDVLPDGMWSYLAYAPDSAADVALSYLSDKHPEKVRALREILAGFDGLRTKMAADSVNFSWPPQSSGANDELRRRVVSLPGQIRAAVGAISIAEAQQVNKGESRPTAAELGGNKSTQQPDMSKQALSPLRNVLSRLNAITNHTVIGGLIVVVVGGLIVIGVYRHWGWNLMDPSTSPKAIRPSAVNPQTQPHEH